MLTLQVWDSWRTLGSSDPLPSNNYIQAALEISWLQTLHQPFNGYQTQQIPHMLLDVTVPCGLRLTYTGNRSCAFLLLFFIHFIEMQTVWHFCETHNLQWKAESILRFILNDYASHYTTLLNNVEMTSLYNMHIQNSLMLVYKSLFLNQYPTYMRNMFAVRHKTYNLRNTHMLTLSKHRMTTYALHSFPYFSTQQWNALHNELRNSTFPEWSNMCKVSIHLISFTNFCLVLCVYFFHF